MNSSNSKVDSFLADVASTSPDKLKKLESIRSLFFESNDQLTDDIKYGGIVFNDADRLIGGIYLYKEHISIEFSQGATFSDPSNLLEGKGKMRRHLKIRESDDINTENARSFIKQAIKSI